MLPDVRFEIDLGEPPEDLIQWAKENINEDPDMRCQFISDLRDMIYERGECTPQRMDDAFLLRFLRARNFQINRAHRLFVNYTNFREDNPQFFKGVHLEKLADLGLDNIISVPPYRDQNGRRFFYQKMPNWDPNKNTIEEIFQATLGIFELALMEQRFQILGGIGIWDFGGLTFQQVSYMTPSIAYKVVQLLVTSVPLKIQELHIVNQSHIFDIIFNIFKPFLNKGMKDRLFFHGSNMESLHKHIDPKYLPEVYGGIHPLYDSKNWFIHIRQNEKIKENLKALGYQT